MRQLIQFTAPQTMESCFLDGRLPRLRHFAVVEGEAGALMRAMHAHEDYAELVIICEGYSLHMIGDGVYHTGPGDVLFYDANVPHYEQPVRGSGLRYYCLGITGLRLSGRRENAIIGETLRPVMPIGASYARIEGLCRMLYEEVNRDRPLTGDICRFLMLTILLDVLEIARTAAMPNEVDGNALGLRIKRYIDAHYREGLTLERISEALGVSPFYLARLFKETTGFSPMQYIINRRIGEAQSLLISTSESIIRVAEKVGYENSNYFSLLFKKNMGMTASEYRRNVGKYVTKDLAD